MTGAAVAQSAFAQFVDGAQVVQMRSAPELSATPYRDLGTEVHYYYMAGKTNVYGLVIRQGCVLLAVSAWSTHRLEFSDIYQLGQVAMQHVGTGLVPYVAS